jgi:hypothetical protein
MSSLFISYCPGVSQYLVDLPQAIDAKAIRITLADVPVSFLTENYMDAITFQDIIVPAFKFAMAMGTNFRHCNCFTPNNIT